MSPSGATLARPAGRAHRCRVPLPDAPAPLRAAACLALALLVGACQVPPGVREEAGAGREDGTPDDVSAASATRTHTPTAEPPLVLALAPEVPPALEAALREAALEAPESLALQSAGRDADLLLEAGAAPALARWTFAAAAPFFTVADGIDGAELRRAWRAEEGRGIRVLVGSRALLEALWGPAGPGVREVTAEELDAEARALFQDGSAEETWPLAVLPFDQLRPLWRALAVDGMSPLDPDFDAEAWPLGVDLGLSGPPEAAERLLKTWKGPRANRDPERLTTVAMTGVSALVRTTAHMLEQNGIAWAAEEIGPMLRAVDIAHINHEVPFATDCPPPDPTENARFTCALDEHFALLEALGTDVVELTGNEVNLHGPEAMRHTLARIGAAGMQRFGGGADAEDARRPALFHHNGNRIAFLGCNPVGPPSVWAEPEWPGALRCDEAFLDEVAELAARGYLVIATQMHWELYHYPPSARQEADFRRIAEAGAAVVSGSQGHHPQTIDFPGSSYVHHGLSNLFFDQYLPPETRQVFVDRLTFYDGRLLSVDLWTGMIEDFARPRAMTKDERAAALGALFDASRGLGPHALIPPPSATPEPSPTPEGAPGSEAAPEGQGDGPSGASPPPGDAASGEAGAGDDADQEAQP